MSTPKTVSISIDETKHKELRKKAIDAGYTFSEYLWRAGSIANLEDLKKADQVIVNTGSPPANVQPQSDINQTNAGAGAVSVPYQPEKQ